MSIETDVQVNDQAVPMALRSAAVGGRQPGDVPDRVVIVPWGAVESTSGNFVVDDDGAGQVVAAFAEHATDLPIDYEHQSLGGQYASPSGLAPAAGWIKALHAEPGLGIVATVQWTDAARQRVASREYRYLSPVAMVRRSDRRLVAIHSVGLTNKPAIVGMQPIVNAYAKEPQPHSEGGSMNEPVQQLRQQLGLDEQEQPEQVLLVASQRLEQLTDQIARRDAEDLVTGAIRAGKLTEAQREWAIRLAMSDRQAYAQWESTAPVVVLTGRTSPPTGGGASQPGRTAVIASARAEYAQHPTLAMLTGEQAFINDALRQCEMDLLKD